MRTIACIALVLGLAAAPLAAEEAPASAESAPATVTVTKGPLGGTLDANGVLVPERYERVTIEFDAYRGKLEIVESAPEGRVVKGQTLLRFDDEDYRRQLKSADRGLEIQRIGLEKAERLHRLSKASQALKRDETKRALRFAQEALERFVSVERKLKEEDQAYGLKGRRISIQNMREELAQLESMYTEDDLTEETEEIVLKRNRRNMERMLESFERWKKRQDYRNALSLEREHESLELSLRKAKASFERLEATEGLDRKKAELDLANAFEGLRKAEEGFAKLRADGEKFTLKAPMAGMAVRGTFVGGSWKGLGNHEAYEAGESMKAGQTPYTVVDESAMRVRTSVKEADLPFMKVGAKATLTTALTGDDELSAEVGKIARYGSGGSYAVILRVTAKDERLRAGLGAKATIERHDTSAVLSVPSSCVQSGKGGAFVFKADGTKVKVKTGKRVGERVEIVEGVDEGTALLATPPKEEPAKEKAAK